MKQFQLSRQYMHLVLITMIIFYRSMPADAKYRLGVCSPNSERQHALIAVNTKLPPKGVR